MHRIKQESCGKEVFLNADLNVTSSVLDKFKEEKKRKSKIFKDLKNKCFS